MSFLMRPLAVAAFLLLGAGPAAAQTQQVYWCAGRDGPTYTHAPCSGGKALGHKRPVAKERAAPPPQDRARRMNRAQLPPETRAQCSALEKEIRQAEARLKARKGPPPAGAEGDLAIQRVRYREMRC
ncbi:hypothetical protein [Ramlibacter tataouinensis]|uniref:DUF4124 domain-containing protein n=1 Tax=Ramlibacter tataouinensis (strain ATCC BAA-407 / DSM 14655 / LMG 21543 / TTB310) TaxID=365046 RepID=F5Y4H3_RAMTT|nr:hypothetical protein [Ramlibacter tataouinensis]AEG93820.1 Hypothetical protein Rta_27180 [Ramlibacter tataouinensis TTB310]